MKKIIKKILLEQIEKDEKSYSLFKKLFNKGDDLEMTAQIFIDANRKDFYLSNGKKIETGKECFEQPYCRCKFIEDAIDWSEMMKNNLQFLEKLDNEYTDKEKRDDIIFDLIPYNYMQYGFTGYESMFLYGRLFKELHKQYCYSKK